MTYVVCNVVGYIHSVQQHYQLQTRPTAPSIKLIFQPSMPVLKQGYLNVSYISIESIASLLFFFSWQTSYCIDRKRSHRMAWVGKIIQFQPSTMGRVAKNEIPLYTRNL